jgi:hypothetical protein
VYMDRDVKRRCVLVLHDLLDTFTYSATVHLGLLSTIGSCIHEVTAAFHSLLSSDAALLVAVAGQGEGAVPSAPVAGPFVASTICLRILRQLLRYLPEGTPGIVAVRTACDSLVQTAHSTLLGLAGKPISSGIDGVPKAVANTIAVALAMHTLCVLVEEVGAALLHNDGAVRELILGILNVTFKKPGGAGGHTPPAYMHDILQATALGAWHMCTFVSVVDA